MSPILTELLQDFLSRKQVPMEVLMKYDPILPDGMIILPIRLGGIQIGHVTRFLDGSGKYLNSGKALAFILFGEDGPAETYYLVEGPFDAMALQAQGKKAVAALQGLNVSHHQLSRLARLTSHVIIVPDPDRPGVRAAPKTAKLLERLGLNVDIKWSTQES